METSRFLKSGLHPEYATQSGPMLVIDGALHPKIEASGTSEKIRNGVGVRDGHIVIFAISDEPVTFYQFATLFRDRLHCPNALFLDGSVSSLYAPDVGRDDTLLPLGPIVGVVEKAASVNRSARGGAGTDRPARRPPSPRRPARRGCRRRDRAGPW